MATQASPARFEPRQQKRGLGWYVLVTWSSGTTAEVSGFRDESDAAEWIKNDSAAWLKARQTGSHD
jgi:hypothetical protein